MQLNLFLRMWKIFLFIVMTLAIEKLFVKSELQQRASLPPEASQDIRNYKPLQPKIPDNRSTAPLAPMTAANSFYKFSAKLFRLISPPLSQTNLIYSPLSLQTILSFIYMGAANQTAQELRNVLELSEMPAEVARQFQNLIQQMQRQSTDFQLQMANKLYYNDGLNLNKEFYKATIPYFNAEAEPTDFRVPEQAAYQINKWAADRTNQRILNLIRPGTLNSNTNAILVNAIYLKAKWAQEFSTIDTQRSNFQMSKDVSVPADMMYTEDTCDFSELSALNAKAINLPFRSGGLSMLILLPNEIDGLAKLEAEFYKVDLKSLLNSLKMETVIVRLPKFRIDFDIDMSEVLKQLGLTRLFSDQAQLNGLFNNQTVYVSKVQQKSYINVNEGGVEAAAATFGKLVPLSAPSRVVYFNADHPFMFLIHGHQAVHFIGHVINP